MKTASAIGLALLLVLTASAASASQKDKDKAKTKEKRYEPIVKLDVNKLAGRYVGIEQTHYLQVAVSENGQLQITSFEGARRAELIDMVMDGPLLTATRAYEDGTTGKFEGTFVDRILNGQRDFGVLVSGISIELDGLTLDRVFYRFVGRGE